MQVAGAAALLIYCRIGFLLSLFLLLKNVVSRIRMKERKRCWRLK